MNPSAPILFFARGLPKAQPRPRATSFRSKDGRRRTRVYDAGSADAWKAEVVAAGRPHRPRQPLAGPLTVHLTFYLPRPGRLQRRKDPDGPIPHDVKPDKDNLEKAVLDALTGDSWWNDDCQVFAGHTEKYYAAKADDPGCLVEVIAHN